MAQLAVARVITVGATFPCRHFKKKT